MSDELDPKLQQLFAQSTQPEGQEFVAALLAAIARRRRRENRLMLLACAVALVLLALAAPALLERSALLAAAVVQGMQMPDASPSPWGWAVSMMLGLAVILHTGRRRR